ncbi:hypothetical protein E2C01_008610 [Portunus trituberculatus]|uniref:Uncharacterized protein n=1 Tax=Portunus trituberculatus TaxID=210409 RepID=A0A5B7D197_PORTR|nr:hypothetical protein [Portunus trituberculatus]
MALSPSGAHLALPRPSFSYETPGTGGFRYRSPPETDASRPLGAVLLRPAHLSATGPVRATSRPTLGPPIPALDTCLIIILLEYLLHLLKIPSCREKFAETMSKVKTHSEAPWRLFPPQCT